MISEKKQKVFNIISLLIIGILGIYYLGRLIYFKYLNVDNTVYSNLLAERVKQTVNKYEVIPTLINENNTYHFTNNAKNNYVNFIGYTWRIMKINEDNSITITTDDVLIKLEQNKVDKWLDEFKNTLDLNYLKDENITNLKSNSDFVDVRPVINLKSTTQIYSGSGGFDDPYIIMENNFETLNDVFVGHYLFLNNSLWKVVSKENDKIKLVSDDYLKENNTNYETDLNNLLKYLNNEYYNSFKEKDLIVKGSFNTDTKKIGLLTIDEIFVYDLKNTFTMSNMDETNVYIIDENNNLYLDSIDNSHYARPALYIKNDIEIKKGNGSYLSPFILGGNNEEIDNNN